MPSLVNSTTVMQIIDRGQWLQDIEPSSLRWSTENFNFDRLQQSLWVQNECLSWLNEPISCIVVGKVEDFLTCDVHELPGIDSLYRLQLQSWTGSTRFETDLAHLPRDPYSLWEGQFTRAADIYRKILFRNVTAPRSSWIKPGNDSALVVTVTERTKTYLCDQCIDPQEIVADALVIAECRLHRVWHTEITSFSYTLIMEMVKAAFRF
ncbi:hypothetical protein VNI00_007342 [Paramarasmius palmivorus]|uniref:Uncharacterized protein n=1 Tax=Paramarasmius palmivorus TaxID=297713 RepID=A0AAW0D212_9AGAR